MFAKCIHLLYMHSPKKQNKTHTHHALEYFTHYKQENKEFIEYQTVEFIQLKRYFKGK